MGGEVVCVFMYRAAPTRNFCRQRKVGLECLGDPEREGYHAVGLGRGGPAEMFSPRIGIAAVRAARHGAVHDGIAAEILVHLHWPGDVGMRVDDRHGNFALGNRRLTLPS